MKTKPPKETTAGRISQARLTRLTRQNEKLEIEVQRLRGEVGPIEVIRREVIRANTLVKGQFLSIGPRLAPQLASMADPREISKLLTTEIEQTCNDLAHGTEKNVDEQGRCIFCGAGEEER